MANIPTPPKPSSIAARLRTALRFGKHDGGVAAVEFALIMPVLMIMFFGTLEMTQAIMVNQRVSHVASSVADLVTQVQAISADEMDDIFQAADSIMAPYGSQGLEIVVAAVDIDSNGIAKVAWSDSHNTTAFTTGQAPPVTIPANLKVTDSQIVIGQIDFEYNSIFGEMAKDIVGDGVFSFKEIFFLKPRVSDTITYN